MHNSSVNDHILITEDAVNNANTLAFSPGLPAVQTSAHPDPLIAATLQAVTQLQRDTWLFIGTTVVAHAALVINLLAAVLS
jgi:hypothetical protein